MNGAAKPIILVVDDEQLLRETLVRRLQHEGKWDVLAAQDYRSGVAAAAQNKVTLVVTDMSYPDENGKTQDEAGRQLILRLSAQDPAMRFVAMSGTAVGDVFTASGKPVPFILKGAGALRERIFAEVLKQMS